MGVDNLIHTKSLEEIRQDFPILKEQVHGHPLIYLDNGATTQRPQQVSDRIVEFYTKENSNVHRGVHHLSQEATSLYEAARKKIQAFIGAAEEEEIIFTTGTTGGINLLAYGFGESHLEAGDEVLVSAMEHHSNIVPWQLACERKGAHLRVIPMNAQGELELDQLDELLTSKTKVVSVTHVSNTLGTINPIKEIITRAHAIDVPVVIDGAQAVAHMPVDVQELDCDFYVFSAHKMFGPTGVGILYGKREQLDRLPPYQGGGNMIKEVSFEQTTYNELPHKFEPGTPNIAGGIGLGAAVDYITSVGFDFIRKHEDEVVAYAVEGLKQRDAVELVGEPADRAGVVSFNVKGVHPYDVGVLLDKLGVAVRTGHHCTQPIMKQFEIPGTVRASFSIYNTKAEVDVFLKALDRTIKLLTA